MKRVIIESPFKGENAYQNERNKRYALECMRDSITRGEAPFLSHLLYTQILTESVSKERNLGIEMGLLWGEIAELTVVYTDNGISEGMQKGIDHSLLFNRPIEYRTLPDTVRTLESYETDKLNVLLSSVSEFFRVPLFDLKSKERKRIHSDARHVYCKVAKDLCPNATLSNIGIPINRDHTTVLRGIREVDRVPDIRLQYSKFITSEKILQCLAVQ